jgi:uracil-DNA glycosylase
VDDRAAVLATLRGLIELDRDSGVGFVGRMAAAPASVAKAPVPVPPTQAAIAPPASEPMPADMPRPRSPAPPGPAPSPTGDSLDAVAAAVAACRACGLCATRTNTVPGEGHPAPELLFVGEGPGADEDAQGRPFVGASGQLLTKMIEAMGLSRAQVFIANVVKCRPPGNRLPEPGEVAACLPFLHRQIALLRPRVICTLGNAPLKALCGPDVGGITTVRGHRLTYRTADGDAILLIPTFHPAYLLRNPPAKKPCWEDLKMVLQVLGRSLPGPG